MSYLQTSDNIPGIRGLMNFRPDTAVVLNNLAQALLVEDASLTRSERELIASFVSYRNECKFCMSSHGAIAANLPDCSHEMVADVLTDYTTAPINNKLKSLLNIAGKVQLGGKHVTEKEVFFY